MSIRRPSRLRRPIDARLYKPTEHPCEKEIRHRVAQAAPTGRAALTPLS
jgi:hypothetical protein